MVKFDVDLDSIPGAYLHGYEVVASFTAHDFENGGTFYTDSNGLEMQKRVLNYRPYYDIEADMYGNHQNVTANYYPVNQAISMKSINNNDQFTVMNDRSQGGSALDEGRIELMQHRRVPADDNKGVTEFLNETDKYDNGIRVPASYYVQVHSLDERPSE